MLYMCVRVYAYVCGCVGVGGLFVYMYVGFGLCLYISVGCVYVCGVYVCLCVSVCVSVWIKCAYIVGM